MQPVTMVILAVAAYLFAGFLFSRSVSSHITDHAYADDDFLRMAVQQGSGSWSMRLPLLTLIIGWLPLAIYGMVSAALEERHSKRLAGRLFPAR